MKPNFKDVHYYIELTSRCNLHCEYCYNDSGIKNNEIKYQIVEKLIMNSAIFYNTSVTLSGGEPLLYTCFYDLLELLNNNKIKTVIASNGTLISDDFLKFIIDKKININYIQISLDSFNPSVNEKTRPLCDYSKILYAIKILRQNGINVTLHCVLNKHNHQLLEEFILAAINLNINTISFSFINKIGRGTDTTCDIPSGTKIDIMKQLNKYRERYSHQIYISIPEIVFGKCPLINNSTQYVSPRIDVNGNVYLCKIFDDPKYAIGNIYDQSIDNILEFDNDLLKNMINTIEAYTNNYSSPKCKICSINCVCNGLCPAIEIMTKKNAYELDGLCKYRKEIIFSYYKNGGNI